MPTDNCSVLEQGESSPAESTSPIDVAYDEENNAVIFHERETGHRVHAWVPDRPDGCAVADLFLTLASKPWATVEVLHATAAVLHEICVKAPGQVTLQDELVSILRSNGNRWMTTSDLAAEVNRRGRHWKTYRNRITGAKVLGRTKLYARTFECMGERVRLIAGAAAATGVETD
jgi:hypothetical protein